MAVVKPGVAAAASSLPAAGPSALALPLTSTASTSAGAASVEARAVFIGGSVRSVFERRWRFSVHVPLLCMLVSR